MLFVAILTHSPENCFMRPENAEAAKKPLKSLRIWKKLQGNLG